MLDALKERASQPTRPGPLPRRRVTAAKLTIQDAFDQLNPHLPVRSGTSIINVMPILEISQDTLSPLSAARLSR
jgi:hypothetical protein